MHPKTHLVAVFTDPASPATGGNPCPLVLDASGLSDSDMRAVAKHHGHESAFLIPSAASDHNLRFFVPEHEMEMCGHATAGTTWALHELGLLKPQGSGQEVRYLTKSGIVRARIVDQGHPGVIAEVSQPRGTVEKVTDESLLQELYEVLGVSSNDLRQGVPVQNACTSRVKTVIPMESIEALNNLKPDFSRVKSICERLNTTGLYPYALGEARQNELEVGARQFPKASGYPEDAATGIAAAALSWALLENDLLKCNSNGERAVVVRQGVAMGCPSQITVRLEKDLDKGCWIGGAARWME